MFLQWDLVGEKRRHFSLILSESGMGQKYKMSLFLRTKKTRFHESFLRDFHPLETAFGQNQATRQSGSAIFIASPLTVNCFFFLEEFRRLNGSSGAHARRSDDLSEVRVGNFTRRIHTLYAGFHLVINQNIA